MPATSDFFYFATGGSANVLSQAAYAAASYVTNGRSSGILPSPDYNKMIRQGSAGAAMLAQFIINQLGQNVLDNGNLTTLVAQLTSAIQQASTIRPGRTVTASSTLTLVLSDYYVWLNRTAAPTALNADLPAGPSVGQEFVIQDIAGNAQAYPVTVVPPVGHTINMNKLAEDNGTFVATYTGSSTWAGRVM